MDKLFDRGFISADDLKYLMERVDTGREVIAICKSNRLITSMLKNFLLTTELIDKYNSLLSQRSFGFTKFELFKLIEQTNQSPEVIDLYNTFLPFVQLSAKEKSQINSIVQNSERARNSFNQILENNVQHTYDFEQLKKLLTKDDNKKKLKMNF